MIPVEQLQIIARLQERVAEFGERDAFAFQAPLDRFLLQQVVHGEMLARIAQKAEQVERRQPVGVVDHAGGIVRRVEIEELLELGTNAGDVPLDLITRDEGPFLGRLRIADHAGASARNRDGRMPGAL